MKQDGEAESDGGQELTAASRNNNNNNEKKNKRNLMEGDKGKENECCRCRE
eukprot:CAMPEP_0113491360 /NCGR_PEP_ID=MMETSP0014_2-20120614/27516_1 /TAXON_ID=2857 /ORGANISM="Nitzschia sp." /LENGTH=50 /DNA_ID=CAMNT_0000385149 /DNA_START=203 /DNA_END=355 /DNA_ORIENTATION=+ /assembly_acc=CAM_ASM_000159